MKLKLQYFLGFEPPHDSTTVSGTNHTYVLSLCSAQFPIWNDIFPINNQCIFFASGIGPDILIIVHEDYIIFLVWVTWAE